MKVYVFLVVGGSPGSKGGKKSACKVHVPSFVQIESGYKYCQLTKSTYTHVKYNHVKNYYSSLSFQSEPLNLRIFLG